MGERKPVNASVMVLRGDGSFTFGVLVQLCFMVMVIFKMKSLVRQLIIFVQWRFSTLFLKKEFIALFKKTDFWAF